MIKNALKPEQNTIHADLRKPPKALFIHTLFSSYLIILVTIVSWPFNDCLYIALNMRLEF